MVEFTAPPGISDDVRENTAPIGIFDSGIGGLTVVHALACAMPHENLIYFGDTARVPYGPKSPDTVRRYARQIADWLVDQGIKALVIACNTATAHALGDLESGLPLPVIGVIGPGARAALERTRTMRVGVIGTAGTIASGAYEREIASMNGAVEVFSRACPLFVPLVEEGWTDHEAASLVAREYLEPLKAAGVDTLVLGCTHYPLLKDVISRVMGDSVQLVDSARETAREVRRVLEERGIASNQNEPGSLRVVVSDDPVHFLAVGKRFLGDALREVEQITFS